MLNFTGNSIDVLTIETFQINKNTKETVVFLSVYNTMFLITAPTSALSSAGEGKPYCSRDPVPRM